MIRTPDLPVLPSPKALYRPELRDCEIAQVAIAVALAQWWRAFVVAQVRR